MKIIQKLIGAFSLVVLFASCDKEKPYDITTPAPRAHFVGDATQIYIIEDASADVYNVNVGTTDVAGSDRIVTYRVTSPTGAVEGTHYTLPGNTGSTGTITIPAGTAIGSIPIQGIYAPYDATGRKDTLIFTLEEPTIKAATFLNTVKVVLRGPCFEGDVVVSEFLGTYANTNESGIFTYGPYTTSISSAISTGPTSATVIVNNIWDGGWGPITFNLDWSNPANRTAIVVPQAAIPGSNAGDLNPAYSGMTIAVRGFAANPGTFSACSSTLTLRMQLGVTGVGWFPNTYTVVMAR